MKLYKRWKRMERSTKIGLATSAVYAATSLALPAYAAINKNSKPENVETLNLDEVITIQGADDFYNKKFEEYKRDKELSIGERENLLSILVKKKSLVDQKTNSVGKKHDGLEFSDESGERYWRSKLLSDLKRASEVLDNERIKQGEVINLEGVDTIEKLDNLYSKKLEEYTKGGKIINKREIENLNRILLKQKNLFLEKKSRLKEEHERLKFESSFLANRIADEQKGIESLKTAPQPESTVKVVSLEGINTLEEAGNLFNLILGEYSTNKEIEFGEVRNLFRILLKEKDFLDESKFVVTLDYVQARRSAAKISKKRADLEKTLENLKQPNPEFLDYIVRKKKAMKDLLERKHPGILKGSGDVEMIYPFNSEVSSEISDYIKEVANEMYCKLGLDYKDDRPFLKNLADNRAELIDVVKLIRIMEEYESILVSSKEELVVRKKSLVEEIESLKSQEESIWRNIPGSKNKDKIDAYFESQLDISKRLEIFSDYFLFKEKSDKFIEKHGDFNRYWSFSAIMADELEVKIKKGYKLLNENDRGLIEGAFNDYLSFKGLEAKIATLKNPAKFKFPWWVIAPVGFGFPILRNILIRRYLGVKGNADYSLATMAGFINGFFGVIVIDGFHPWVFWIRMASPLIIQPALKLMGQPFEKKF